ncbi:hypothetical protein BJY00DRAFT_282604 [Aspergillus carlsbadensis]|nr:hypothetical protein BJY00DRAFT_282604 [Aspergillus carlsbadensis]
MGRQRLRGLSAFAVSPLIQISSLSGEKKVPQVLGNFNSGLEVYKSSMDGIMCRTTNERLRKTDTLRHTLSDQRDKPRWSIRYLLARPSPSFPPGSRIP